MFCTDFCAQHKLHKEHFTRNRVFTFGRLIAFQMNIATKSLSVELTRFFHRITGNIEEQSFSKQSYSEARMKFKHTAFIELNEDFVTGYYADGDYKLYKGYRLIAIDGSRLLLPNTESMTNEFGIAENNNKSVPMAMTSVAYDVLNHIAINAYMDKYATSERLLADRHLEKIRELMPTSRDILLLDRGYPSVPLCAKMLVLGYNFVIRCNETGFLNEVKAFAQNGENDQLIEIDMMKGTLARRKRMEGIVQGHSMNKVQLRIVKIVLNNGTVEYLMTSLIDKEAVSLDELKALYHLRWNEETYFNFQKNVLEIENWSGKTPEAVRQDYYARVFSANLNSLLIEEAQEQVDAETENNEERKYERYIINRTVATGILKDEMIEMLFTPKDQWEKKMDMLIESIKKHIVPHVPDRSFPRNHKVPNKAFLKRRKAI